MSTASEDHIRSWHESAHGVLAHVLGGRVVFLTLESDEEGLAAAATIEWPAASEREAAEASGMTALAGPLAELERFSRDGILGWDDLASWRGDWNEVMRCAAALVHDEHGREQLVNRWIARVRRLLGRPETGDTIARVADALEAHGTLDEALFAEALG